MLDALPAQAREDAPAPRATSLLRFFTCGSVDDGKSTLIGRLLYETGSVFDDQLEALDRDSRKFGTQGAELDYALLLDGLSAEREQGITIDVAYRYFSHGSRAFIVADTPGHEQYTRNMATGASTAELAIILVDARKGVLPQTRRHAYIVSMLGVKNIILAVNKMDLAGFAKARFEEIGREFRSAAGNLGFASLAVIPLSAKDGDNVVMSSRRTPWYEGPPLLRLLETIEPMGDVRGQNPFAFPVQWVNRPDLDFRGYAGTIASGAVAPGDEIVTLPGARSARVSRIVTFDGDRERASAGEAVTLTLDREIDVSRGDVITATTHHLSPRRSLVARLLWMIDDTLATGRDYIIQHAAASANARVAAIHHAIDMETYATRPASRLAMNEIGLVTLACDKPLIVADYRDDRDLGSFILIDRLTNQTAGMGVIELAPAPQATATTVARQEAPSLLAQIAGPPETPARRSFRLRSSLEAAAALTLAAIVWLLTQNLLASLAVIAFEVVARALIHAIGARGEPSRTALDEVNEGGGGI